MQRLRTDGAHAQGRGPVAALHCQERGRCPRAGGAVAAGRSRPVCGCRERVFCRHDPGQGGSGRLTAQVSTTASTRLALATVHALWATAPGSPDAGLRPSVRRQGSGFRRVSSRYGLRRHAGDGVQSGKGMSGRLRRWLMRVSGATVCSHQGRSRGLQRRRATESGQEQRNPDGREGGPGCCGQS